MFKKKEPAKKMDRVDVEFKFKDILKRIDKDVAEIDEKIQDEVSKAQNFKRSNRLSDVETCKKRIRSLTSRKCVKLVFYDKVEGVRDRILTQLDNIELARTMGEVYQGLDIGADTKEFKNLINEINEFNAKAEKTDKLINSTMDLISEKTENQETISDSQLNAMIDTEMQSYDEMIDSVDNEDLEENIF